MADVYVSVRGQLWSVCIMLFVIKYYGMVNLPLVGQLWSVGEIDFADQIYHRYLIGQLWSE